MLKNAITFHYEKLNFGIRKTPFKHLSSNMAIYLLIVDLIYSETVVLILPKNIFSSKGNIDATSLSSFHSATATNYGHIRLNLRGIANQKVIN